jgi:sulfate adenylyltransferase subunit 2
MSRSRRDQVIIDKGTALEDAEIARLASLEAESIFIIREAYRRVRPITLLWSIGKDSTALVWLARKAFLGSIPFPVMLLDTGMEFPEVYAFRDALIAQWGLDYRNEICPPESAVDQTLPPAARAAARKTEGLRYAVARDGYNGVLLGIRRDEQAVRAKEKVFSRRAADGSWDFRNQSAEFWGYYDTTLRDGEHCRIHPLLHWTELDVWLYTRAEKIPFCPLYLSKGTTRFRSLGEKNITEPIESRAASLDEIIAELRGTNAPERAGRVMDFESEDAFERLRAGGYM